MAHFGIVCREDAGHLLSIGPLGNELVRRGHQVTFVAREKAAGIAEQLGLPLHKVNYDDVPWRGSFVEWAAFSLFRSGWRITMRDGFRWRAEAVLQKMPEAFRELKLDGLIVDQTVSSAGTAAERVGIPFVTICSAVLWNEEPDVPPQYTSWLYGEDRRSRFRNRLGYAAWHWFNRLELKTINRYRDKWGMSRFSRIDDAFSPLAQISQMCPGFDFPRKQAAPQFHYIGSLAAQRRVVNEPPFPWERLDGRPLIFASLGTVPDPQNPPVFRKILAACQGLDAQLVLALGKWEEEEKPVRDMLGPIPDNALVVDFAPQLALLDRANLLITHAGVNTVLEAICRGVPMVALPRSADQPAMGARVVYSGVGLRGSFRQSTPEQLRELIHHVLADDSFRQRCRTLGQTMTAAGGVQRAAEITEQALLSRRPVYGA
ncbi:MAG: nucleotide disphospho-sugar-binding domain-containing protein [Thermoguttaceae bacterium]